MIRQIFIFLFLFGGLFPTKGQSQQQGQPFPDNEKTIPTIIDIQYDRILLNDGRQVLLKGLAEDSIQLVFIIRHVEEDSIGLDPGLSRKGESEAQRLSLLMQKAHIKHIYSILFRRTVLTVRPLVKATQIPIKHFDPGEIDYLTEVYFKKNNLNSLVVGTRQSIRELLNELVGIKKYKLLPRSEYNRIYIAEIQRQKPISIREFKY